jgi:UDP-N-acetylmuramoyl-L-alanyl-D-glutamate--2,6-diaminopimelate ligase
MAQIASRLADKIIITSDNSRGEDTERIFEDILAGIDKNKNYTLIKDRAEAIEEAILTAKCADVILLAGKGHEKYEIDTKGKHFFDEVQAVKSAYNKRNCKQ